MSGKYRQRVSSLPLLIRKLVARRQAPPIYLGSRWAYSYNLANQISGFSYDLNGNLTDDGPLAYQYDAANRLRKVIRGAETLEYAYTGNGDRYAHTLTHGAEITSVNYLLDPSGALSRVLSETIDTPTTDWTNTYLYGLGILGQQNGSTWSTFGTDPLGSMRFLLDNTGAIASRADYDPYGVPLPVPGQESGMDTALGFTGEQTDPLGLVNLRARTYNPRLGAFTSVDPVEGIMSRSASRNGYSYVEGNPANLVDPSGKIWWFLPALILGTVFTSVAVGSATLAVWDITSNQKLSILPWDKKFFLTNDQWNYDQTRAATGLGLVLGGSIGVGLGMAMLNPLGATIGAGTNFVGGLISGHRSADELTIDALVGGAFGGLFGAVVPGPNGIWGKSVFRTSMGSVTLDMVTSRLGWQITTGGTLNMLQGATTRIVRNRMFRADEAITPGNLALDFAIGGIVTGTLLGGVRRFAQARVAADFVPIIDRGNILNSMADVVLNSSPTIAISSTILSTNIIGGYLSSKPSIFSPIFYQNLEEFYHRSWLGSPILK